MSSLEGRADGLEVLARDLQRVVGDPAALAACLHRAVLRHEPLAGILRPRIREVERGVLVIAHAHEQHLCIQLIEPADGRAVAENVRQVVLSR